MSNRNALLDDFDFDDDFDTDFGADDTFDSDSLKLDDEFEMSAPPEPNASAMSGATIDPQAMAQVDDALTGNITVPRITVHAFVERAGTSKVIDTASDDRRLSKAIVEIHEGGLSRAIQTYQEQSTPDLLIIESSLPGKQMLAQIDALAELWVVPHGK